LGAAVNECKGSNGLSLGLDEWCSLSRRETETYKPGLFNLNSRTPAATALPKLVRALACAQSPKPTSLPPAGG
jgi:hypothetical protein